MRTTIELTDNRTSVITGQDQAAVDRLLYDLGRAKQERVYLVFHGPGVGEMTTINPDHVVRVVVDVPPPPSTDPPY